MAVFALLALLALLAVLDECNGERARILPSAAPLKRDESRLPRARGRPDTLFSGCAFLDI